MINVETLIHQYPAAAGDAVVALGVLARCHYADGNIETGLFYGQLSNAVQSAVGVNPAHRRETAVLPAHRRETRHVAGS